MQQELNRDNILEQSDSKDLAAEQAKTATVGPFSATHEVEVGRPSRQHDVESSATSRTL